MILREVGLYAGLGFALGLPAVAAAGQAMKALLFGIEPLDPWAIAGACLLMAAVVLFSGYIPARRAAAIDPAVTLRVG